MIGLVRHWLCWVHRMAPISRATHQYAPALARPSRTCWTPRVRIHGSFHGNRLFAEAGPRHDPGGSCDSLLASLRPSPVLELTTRAPPPAEAAAKVGGPGRLATGAGPRPYQRRRARPRRTRVPGPERAKRSDYLGRPDGVSSLRAPRLRMSVDGAASTGIAGGWVFVVATGALASRSEKSSPR